MSAAIACKAKEQYVLFQCMRKSTLAYIAAASFRARGYSSTVSCNFVSGIWTAETHREMTIIGPHLRTHFAVEINVLMVLQWT